jgi:hypothetical protein
MGLALDEPKADDEKIKVNGLSFVIAKDVTEAVQVYGDVSIDYQDRPFFMKGFRLSFARVTRC